ncbi:hypothetical protein WR51_17255 [Bacillus cereus]|nr:hypothetical protein WR47_17255 [Bacillus cereus]OTY20572.1 hypothetical protein BK734_01710 [Bacillus thuringiensis serovar kim]PDY28252.1 hypothetical protein COM84_18535 [Bacillus thuringiensis]ANC14589.1 hypothetical protein WR51_17255 [Bacillus cereus]PEV51719.1 hypothetical protein CN426_01105 [Bacillus thuringiensis]
MYIELPYLTHSFNVLYETSILNISHLNVLKKITVQNQIHVMLVIQQCIIYLYYSCYILQTLTTHFQKAYCNFKPYSSINQMLSLGVISHLFV